MQRQEPSAPRETGATAAETSSSAATKTPGDKSLAPVVPIQRYVDFRRQWPVPRRGEILVVPVGGIGRIGMNWTLYGHDGRWILVDAGIAFPDRRSAASAGVDAWVPDPSCLAPILPHLDGLVITHGHEDHLGAVDKLWPSAIDCPIYATPFAAKMLDNRLEEAGTREAVDIRLFQPGSSFRVGAFEIETVRVTHSVPEPVMVALRTPIGTVVHTGDWKFDPDPVIGLPPDFDALRRLGDEGVLAVLCDSTCAQRPGRSGSEGSVTKAFASLFASRRGLVVVCCFSSNIARMASVAAAGAASGRKVAVAGRSMRSNEVSARGLGLLDAFPEFLAEPSHLNGLDRREMALVCTGGQGEERAALWRLANGDRRLPQLEPGDTVVLSGRTVPGNEGAVESLVAKLKKAGVEVIRPGELVDGNPVQVSGHPARDELVELYGMLRPKVAIPVHGTYEFQEAHACLARGAGVERALCCEERDVIKLTRCGADVLGRVEIAPLAIASEDDRRDRRRAAARP